MMTQVLRKSWENHMMTQVLRKNRKSWENHMMTQVLRKNKKSWENPRTEQEEDESWKMERWTLLRHVNRRVT